MCEDKKGKITNRDKSEVICANATVKYWRDRNNKRNCNKDHIFPSLATRKPSLKRKMDKVID